MRPAFLQRLSDGRPAMFGRRARGIALALAVELLFAIGLFTLGTTHRAPRPDERTAVFAMATPDEVIAPKAAPRGESMTRARQSSGGGAPRDPTPPAPPAPPSPPVPAVALKNPPGLIVLGQEDMASSDISRIPSHRGEGSAGDGDSVGKDSGSAYGPSQGPGGAPLYAAEWYREPTDAELAHYMPPMEGDGWADIECRTIEAYHVENCRTLAESPVGSGLGRGLRQAAWQFLIRPPRVGGKAKIGAWVRIHYDLRIGIRK